MLTDFPKEHNDIQYCEEEAPVGVQHAQTLLLYALGLVPVYIACSVRGAEPQ